MIKPVFYIVFTLFIAFHLKSQENLVPNGSFEEFSTCPQSIGQLNCNSWFSPTITTPDFYTTCGIGGSGEPLNSYGFQNAFNGNSYVGIVLNSDDGYREYLGVKLLKPLKPLEHYLLKINVSSSDLTKYGSNNLGAYFLKDTSNISLQTMSSGTPVIISNSNIVFESSILSDTINWLELSFEYISKGCEEYMLIGNFNPQNETEFGENHGIGVDSYYFIDNIILVESKESSEIANLFTPNNDGINDCFEVEGISCKSVEIVNPWGNIVYEDIDKIKWDGSSQLEGVYYYKIDFGCNPPSNIKTGFVQLIR